MDSKKCENCFYWSEMIAKSIGGTIHALCLNADSQFKDEYTEPTKFCLGWQENTNGSVDDPHGGE
jgi:hypothetical protein